MVRYYYVHTIEKLQVAMCDMFDQLITLSYTDYTRKDYSRIRKIPLVLNSDPKFAQWWRNTQASYQAMPMPIAGLRMSNKTKLDAERIQPVYMRSIFSRAAERWITDASPTPVKYTFTLDVLCDAYSDANQIDENIIPYFNTDRALRIKEFDFAPDIERKVPVYLSSFSQKPEDEISDNKKHKYITNTYNFDVCGVMYRPFKIEDIIRYAEMRVETEDFNHVMQYIPYPTAIAKSIRRAWEDVKPSIRTGYSILKNFATTLIKSTDESGMPKWVDVSLKDYEMADGTIVPDTTRPRKVPEYDLLHFNFDENTPATEGKMPEPDRSGYGRDFVAVDPTDVKFIENLPPGAGKDSLQGWKPDPDVKWNRILDWFGTNDGLNEDNLTFSSTLQFKEAPPADCLFQYLANTDDVGIDGVTKIPPGEVYFEWGLTGQKLYFTFKTYGTNAQFATFMTKNPLELNNTSIYRFYFALYDEGANGMFGYSLGYDGTMVALETEKT